MSFVKQGLLLKIIDKVTVCFKRSGKKDQKLIQFYAHGRRWTPTEFVDFKERLSPADINICLPKFRFCEGRNDYEGIIAGGEIYQDRNGHIACTWKSYHGAAMALFEERKKKLDL